MKIWLVGSQKGGVGKTTTSTNLATELSSLGFEVCLVDANHEQQSSTKWLMYRQENETKGIPQVSGVILAKNIAKNLTELSKKYDYLIVDAAGGDTVEQRSALTVADCYITTFEASQIDIDSIESVTETFELAKGLNEKINGYIFINKCDTSVFSKDENEAISVVQDSCGLLTLLNTRLCHRKAYKRAYGQGLSVSEYSSRQDGTNSDLKAKEEIKSLTKEILNNEKASKK